MKLLEHQGKEMLGTYGIAIPRSVLIDAEPSEMTMPFPLVLKYQVPSGDRKKKGGIAIVDTVESFSREFSRLLLTPIDGIFPQNILVEEKIDFEKEWYISLSYDTDRRSPVLALSETGGSGVASAQIVPLTLVNSEWVLPTISIGKEVARAVQCLCDLFIKEKALLAEINPLFELVDGSCVAGDAKIILDDAVADPKLRPYLDLGGDIAILASGGGASLLNLDALMRCGGKPANYVEYSGNPPASVVEELVVKVLSRPGLTGCFVIGGTANFTDIYETLSGFVQGLRKVNPKPAYPIVIRRDGPRRQEAFAMLKEVGEKEGYDFHLYGPETPMSEAAKIMVERAYEYSHQ